MSPAAGQSISTYLTYPIKPEWVEKRCSVVAYLLDDASKQVLQVVETKLK